MAMMIPAALKRLLPPALAALLGGCSSIGLLNAAQPKGGVKVERDIAFSGGERGRLDVYSPVRARSAPVVVFIYGGNWRDGKKSDYAFVGYALARQGFVTVIPDYRLYPAVRYPDFLRDGAQAVRWTEDHAAAYGGAPSNLFLMGHSAGGYNALSLAINPQWIGEVGMRRDQIRGAIGLSGAYDFLPLHDDTLKIIFGPEKERPATQPINYVDGAQPPMLLAADLGDQIVDPNNATRLAGRVQEKGGKVETRLYRRRLGHALVVAALADPLRFLGPVMKDVATFIRQQSQP
ncbi:MAG: alpha/beta hydrolase fold family protein [Caulobacteraceae bacterium]|nr:alpha/beta hydrolase fold family protein [Caulobacteraceae bacterium]